MLGCTFLNRRLLDRTAVYRISSRQTHTATSRWKKLTVLEDDTVDTFRRNAFGPSQPALLPKGTFLDLPAVQKWFTCAQADPLEMIFNQDYLDRFGQMLVPLELTYSSKKNMQEIPGGKFQRAEAPLHIFLQWAQSATPQTHERFYLAQCSITALPDALAADLHTPDIVRKAGTGDIYDTNIWLGLPPTYTPLHRDPNPNLFVQIAGSKVVRMLPQALGDKVFAHVQSRLGRTGSAAFRGEEMMKGEEKAMIEAALWEDAAQLIEIDDIGYEACVNAGDGVFIPKGWWHSVKGVGSGVSGSVNWWFR